jgi:uncharacterized repeat protein (TIGR01451 family)
MIVKKNPTHTDTRYWNTDVVRLWWFCLLMLLFLILFSGKSFGQASISGYAWMDVNKNGIQGDGERGFSGVRVQLFRRLAGDTFEPLTSLRTQSDGSFLILVSGTLLPAEFYLTFEKVPGMYFSPPDLGANDLVDSDADTSSGKTPLFSLADQANAIGWNAGYMSSPLIVPPLQPAANLYLNVAVSTDSANIGETVEFTIAVSNNGPDSSIAPILTMEVAASMQYVSSTPAPQAPAANPLQWAIPSLAMGEVYEVTLQMQVISEGEATGAICLSPTTEDPDLDDNCYQYLLNNGVPVELTDFSAEFTGHGVLIQWITASETENFGFQLFRSDAADGFYEKITPTLIEGAGTTSSEHRYEYFDAAAASGATYYYKLQDIDYSGQMAWHGPIVAVSAQPVNYGLSQNYPNPFNSQTRIRFTLGQAGHAELTIYNQLGQRVTRIFAQEWSAGQHEVTWDGTDEFSLPVSSGLYFCVLQAGSYQEKRIMNLIK